MAKAKRSQRGPMIKAVGKGVLGAAGVSLLGIVLFALALKVLNLPDSVISIINQIIKILSVLAGSYLSVGVAGDKGAVKGALSGAGYMAVGLTSSMIIAGQLAAPLMILSDLALGGAVGALGGAILANMAPRTKNKTAKTARLSRKAA